MVRTLALAAALLGGMAWVAHLFVVADVLGVAGLVLLAVAVFLAGTSLARRVWLAAVTGGGAVALSWSLLELARGHAEDRVVEGVAGGLATLVVAVVVARGPRVGTRSGNHRG